MIELATRVRLVAASTCMPIQENYAMNLQKVKV
jgi:hypothetical protein